MDWKKIGKQLLFPPVWLMVLLTLVSTAALVLIFLRGWEETVPAYICYVVAFYTLSVVTIFCSMVLPKCYHRIRQKILSTPLGNRYMTDRAFRTEVSLYIALSISLIYVAINVLFWHLNRSWWFIVLAIYYGILAVMRFLLVRYVRKHELGAKLHSEWKRARICAYILLLVNISLSGAVLMILYENKGYDYPGMLIYVMAAHAFYATSHAIVEIVKYRKLGSPVISTTKVISLSTALVSMLNLETAMFSQFGQDMAADDQRLMIILTGAGISITIVTLALLLILRAHKVTRERQI